MDNKEKFTDKLIKEIENNGEENIALEIAEDKRLRRLGIDPNLDSASILDKLDELAHKHKTQNE